MNETELQNKFSNFLQKEKGFVESSLLKEMLSGTDYKENEVDLILIDLESSEILGIVVFKESSNIKIRVDSKLKIDSYKRQFGLPQIPFYLVYPKESEIGISAWINGLWTDIKLENFPHYDSLRAKNKVDKHKKEEAKKNLIEEKQTIKRNFQYKYSKWVLSSIAFGVIVSILLMYLNQAKNQSSEITSLTREITSLEARVESYKRETERNEVVIDSFKYIDGSVAFEVLEKRMDVLEEGLLQTPEKFLDYRRLSLEIFLNRSALEYQNDKIDYSLSYLIDKINILQGIVWGLMLAFISSILGYFFLTIKERK